MRKSPRRSTRQKENIPISLASPQKILSTPKKMQRTSSLESPPKRISPRKTVLGAGSFYSKQKPLYLTPLERKLLKETKSPPSVPIKEPSHLPLNAGNPVKKPVKKVQKKGTAAGPQSNLKDCFTAKPKAKNPSDTQTDQLLKATVAPISFSSMKSKSKPKLLVGAAFFSTGKKPTSMFKRSAQNTKPKQPSTYEKPTKEKEALTAPGERSPVRRAVFLKKHPRAEATATVTTDEDGEGSESTQVMLSPKQMSPHILGVLHGITKELKVVLRRSVSPSGSSEAGSQVRLNS